MVDIERCLDISYSGRNNAKFMSYSSGIFVWVNIRKIGEYY